MYYVYVLYNETFGKFYTGQTINLEERVKLHNEHTLRGYTSRFRGEWRVIHKESFSTRSEALQREKQLKSGMDERTLNLCSNNHNRERSNIPG